MPDERLSLNNLTMPIAISRLDQRAGSSNQLLLGGGLTYTSQTEPLQLGVMLEALTEFRTGTASFLTFGVGWAK